LRGFVGISAEPKAPLSRLFIKFKATYRTKILKVFSAFLAFCVFSLALSVLETSVSSESTYRTWLQTDPRWADLELGVCGESMAEIGCAVTAVAVLAVHSGSVSEDSFDPGILCQYLSENDGFNDEGDIYWGAVAGLIPSLTYEDSVSFSESTQISQTEQLEKFLNDGYFAVISVKNYLHWVAVDCIIDGVVYIIDPAYSERIVLYNEYEASGLMNIKLFKGANSTGITKPTIPPASETLNYVKTNATSGLNHRVQPGTSYDSNGIIPYGTTLYVMGVQYGWANVYYNGKNGWCSLEYLEKSNWGNLGDLDNDGIVTINDAIYIFRYISGNPLTTEQHLIGDMNFDTKVDVVDLVIIINIIIGKIK
jgi:uncharacterized protein YgiM (DUF1202 family)